MPPPLSMSTFTAGAIPVTNEKGQTTMQKVKVTRYVSGKRPEYAPSESEEEEDEFIVDGEAEPSSRFLSSHVRSHQEQDEDLGDEDASSDPRLQRLRTARPRNDAEESEDEPAAPGTEDVPVGSYRRRIAEPEIASEQYVHDNLNFQNIKLKMDEDSDEDEEAIATRRAMVRERAQERIKAEQIVGRAEEEEESEENSEYDETDSEDEAGPRLKPVFIPRQDRVTLQEREAEERRQAALAKEAEKQGVERRAEARRIVEAEVKREMQDNLQKKTSILDDANFEIPVLVDNEDPEAEYEGWKVRELTRLKRDRDEREAMEREQQEAERVRGLTEEERLRELAKNPKEIINKAAKGKMKFLQKYYHRGVFYLDKDEHVLKRDYTAPTLEDHHDKTVLPKVMQVKNFGRAGRTKYTHLVDQDTTKFDSAWTEQTHLNLKYYAGKAGGTKQMFDKPSAKRRKT